jgi:tetratricopeptide (TPR) repeat protein
LYLPDFGKLTFFVVVFCFFVPLFSSFPVSPDGTPDNKTETGYYIFHTSGNSDLPSSFFTWCDKNIDFYNDFLRLPGNNSSFEKMRITIFDSETKMNNFLKDRGLPQGKPVILFLNSLQNSSPSGAGRKGRFEIAAIEEAVAGRDFRINCFYQFLRSSIPSPPKWLEAGIALYLEEELKVSSAPDIFKNTTPGKAVYFSHLSKLIKQQGEEKTIQQIKELLTGMTTDDINMYLIHSWVIVEFMMDMKYGTAYSRLLWDSLPLLKPEADSSENNRIIAAYFSQWLDIPLFTEKLLDFIDESEKLEDIYAKGKKLYENGAASEAESIFNAILYEDPENYFSLYYKGLILHSEGKFDNALDYYTRSLSSGGDAALLCYASGLSYYAKGDTAKAAFFLEKAADISPERFKALARAVLDVINELN